MTAPLRVLFLQPVQQAQHSVAKQSVAQHSTAPRLAVTVSIQKTWPASAAGALGTSGSQTETAMLVHTQQQLYRQAEPMRPRLPCLPAMTAQVTSQ